MAIIITKNGEEAEKINRSSFEKEDYLQNYIHENPESIPVYEIQEDKKLFVVAREFSTGSGPIDALAIDKDGDIYVVETKLYKNPDKRTVVAQALDYGASLWKHTNDFTEFTNVIDQEIQSKFKISFQEKISDFFEMEQDDVQLMLGAMESNLKEGNIKFVILMDSMDERLKDLIIYVNQNSRFDIYAVQMEYYKFQEYEIMIPRIFGVEVKKNIKKSHGGTRKKWTKEEFLEDVRRKTDSATAVVIRDILEFSYSHADKVTYGTGSEGVFSYKLDTSKGEITPFFMRSDGMIQFNLGWAKAQKKITDKAVDEYMNKLGEIPAVSIQDDNQQDVKLFLYARGSKEEDIDAFKNSTIEFTKGVKMLEKNNVA